MKRRLKVTEIFTSIQGESTHAGKPCAFVRLAGCNLNCTYCDTAYSKSLSHGKWMSLPTILAKIRKAGIKLVEITGGEPLLQAGTPALCKALIRAGFEVLVETNGSLDVSVLPNGAIRILDCKCPDSGEAASTDTSNFGRLARTDEIKFVVSGRKDYLYTRRMIAEWRLDRITPNILISPVRPKLDPARLAKWMLADRIPARMQLQIHKIIWHPEKRKV